MWEPIPPIRCAHCLTIFLIGQPTYLDGGLFKMLWCLPGVSRYLKSEEYVEYKE